MAPRKRKSDMENVAEHQHRQKGCDSRRKALQYSYYQHNAAAEYQRIGLKLERLAIVVRASIRL